MLAFGLARNPGRHRQCSQGPLMPTRSGTQRTCDTQWEREALKHICFSWILRFGKPRFPRDQDAVARWEVCSSRRWADPPARVLRTLALLDDLDGTAGFIGASHVSDHLVCCTIPLPPSLCLTYLTLPSYVTLICIMWPKEMLQADAIIFQRFEIARDCTLYHIHKVTYFLHQDPRAQWF